MFQFIIYLGKTGHKGAGHQLQKQPCIGMPLFTEIPSH